MSREHRPRWHLRSAQSKRMTEAQLRRAYREYAKSLGYLVYHTHDSRRSDAGFLDDVLVNPEGSVMFMFEAKGDRGRVSAEQVEWVRRCDNVPGVYAQFVWPEDLDWILNMILAAS